MMDAESESLWSHILGLCVEGEHKGTRLETLPSDMLTWSAWKAEHPETTVLNLKRTNRNYTSEFYKSPDRFVIGIHGEKGMCHVSFATLKHALAVNLDARGTPVLITFDDDSTSARVFDRTLGERELTFSPVNTDQLQDRETGSIWNRSGVSTNGELKGQTLQPLAGIISFRKAWTTFHARSQELTTE